MPGPTPGRRVEGIDMEFEAAAVPWAMQLALRDDRDPAAAGRPTHVAACEAVAAAVVALLCDPRSTDGPWRDAVTRWSDTQIRKVVRRGRGVRFAAVETLPGVSVQRGTALVRAFVPGPVDQVPPELARLQVGNTDQPERGEPSSPQPGGVTIAHTPAVGMTTGKAAAQAGHAAQLALLRMPGRDREEWRAGGFGVRVIAPDEAAWQWLSRRAPVVVRDAGHTEVPPGTTAAVAWWPATRLREDGSRGLRRRGRGPVGFRS